ncbi:MAG: hypothetical protein JO337_13655 [Acidimicrobiales bacterium]|nr:hypothetical protein [Acidimicrobiales bacterium]
MASGAGEVRGPVREARNYLQGGLHSGEQARRYGFPDSGAIGANMHVDRFPPVLVEAFGQAWISDGWLSAYFENVAASGTHVQVVLAVDESGRLGRVSLVDADREVTIAQGNAGLGSYGRTELAERDLRLSDPSKLRGFAELTTGTVIGDEVRTASEAEQLGRIQAGEIDDALDCWSEASDEWGGVVACPSTVVSILFDSTGRSPAASWVRRKFPDAATMFGALELRSVGAPILLDRPYRVTTRVVGVGASPRTEYCWWDSEVEAADGTVVATARALTRVFTASL